MRRLIPVFLVLPVLLFSVAGFAETAAAANPWQGTWTLDTGASKLATALLQLKMTIADADTAKLKFSLDGFMANGTEIHQSFEGKPDGSLHPVLEKGKPASQASYRWTSDRALHGEAGGPGGAKETVTLELASDGKSFTETRHIKSAAREYEEIRVYRK